MTGSESLFVSSYVLIVFGTVGFVATLVGAIIDWANHRPSQLRRNSSR